VPLGSFTPVQISMIGETVSPYEILKKLGGQLQDTKKATATKYLEE
jgi:hypothetical protein